MRQVLQGPSELPPTLDEREVQSIEAGDCERLEEKLGAHPREHRGVSGTAFAVLAPAARAVSVVGDFNDWDGRVNPMRPLGGSGIWELFLPAIGPGARYMFEILALDGERVRKADPYARQAEPHPRCSSVVCVPAHRWSVADREWRSSRAEHDPLHGPISIYEVHLGSWRRNAHEGNRPLSYIELADQLSAYVGEMGFTHVQLLPVMAHPFSGSWGYQVTSYFAPEPRHGAPDELQQLVDRLHANGVGVLLDWVPAHFSQDDFALRRFDGTALFEHEDPHRSAHPEWGTLLFDYGSREVRSFLTASALFWLREYHADGIRVDAVASMLYLDHAGREGEGSLEHLAPGRVDADAADFLRELNDVIAEREPSAITVAEDTSVWPGVSKPTVRGGLGFGFKWNTGWVHDTLGYFGKDPAQRRACHHEITFSLMYAYSENFILPLSHDDVVPGKGSLLSKMAGDRGTKLANLRVLYAYTWAHPGKQLLFMGNEFAQEREWSDQVSLDWQLLERPEHAAIQNLVRDLNRLYRHESALWQLDREREGFRWLDPDDAEGGVIAFVRAACDQDRRLVFAANLSPTLHPSYRLGLPLGSRWQTALSTDAACYGGSDRIGPASLQPEPIPWQGQPVSAEVTLPPLTAIMLVPETA